MKKTALITGASSGIGKELAHIHAERGGNVVIVARRQEKLQALKRELESNHKINVLTIAKDLTHSSTPQEIYDEVSAKGRRVDYLINNAGFGGHGKFHEREWAQDKAMIDLNIMALTALCRLFLPEMVSRKSGKILNVSSTASMPPGGPLQSVYFATKHFVTAFSYGIAEEVKEDGVSVTALLPGATATEFAQSSGMDKTDLFDKTVTARSVAEDGYNGMIKGKLSVVSGLTFGQKLMMSMVPVTPKRVLLRSIRQMQEAKS